MSLYNQILGTHPFSKHLLVMLGVHPGQYGRLRDLYLKKVEEKLRIVVFTRNGGGNRSEHQHVFEALSKHPNYIRDYDDDCDETYANIEFSIPDKYQKIADEIFAITPEERGLKLFQSVIANMGNSQNPFAQRALQIGKEIVDKISQNLQSADSQIIEV